MASSCDVAIVVVVVRRERRIEGEKKDGQLAVNIYSAFSSLKGTSPSTEMTCRLYL